MVEQELMLVRQEVESRYVLLALEVQSQRSDVARDREALRLSMTVGLGSMLFIGLDPLFATQMLNCPPPNIAGVDAAGLAASGNVAPTAR